MKRLLPFFIALLLAISFTTPSYAAQKKQVKVPANICWGYDLGGGDYRFIAVAIKKGLRITFADGNTNLYTVQGVQNIDGAWATLTGTAYVIDYEEQIITMQMTSDWADFYSFELYYDINDEAGLAYIFRDQAGAEMEYPLTKVDCKQLTPYYSN